MTDSGDRLHFKKEKKKKKKKRGAKLYSFLFPAPSSYGHETRLYLDLRQVNSMLYGQEMYFMC